MTPSHPDSPFEEIALRTDQVVFRYDISTAKLTYLNAAFLQVWERDPVKVQENPTLLLEWVYPEELTYLEKAFKELLQGEDKKGIQFRIIKPDGSLNWVTLTAFLINDQTGDHISGYVEDIEEQRANMETLRKFSSKKNSILEMLSHDLAGPLGMVRNLAAMLSEKMQPYGNQQLIELARVIETTCGHNLDLIRNLLNQEYLESANVAMLVQRINLVTKTKEIVEQYQQGIGSRGKTFTFETSAEEIYVEVDEVKFIQVTNNLLSNANKFTRENGIITTKIVEKKDPATGVEYVLLSVSDNGIGIPASLQPFLFDKFTKARRSGLAGEEPVGLGLSVVKTVVELHDGQIWLESEENKGTTFFVQIPKNRQVK